MNADVKGNFVMEETVAPVIDTCDVLVAGGGTAGVIAALAAAQNGAKTVLVEENTFLGGAMLGGGVILMGFHNIYKPYGVEPVQLIRGLGDELRKRLVERHGSTDFHEDVCDPVKESMGLHADREVLPQVLLDMLKEAGVTLYLRVAVVDAIMEDSAVRGVVLESKSGREVILAKAVIDTTGSADVARHAGAEIKNFPERRSGGLAFGLGNVDFEKIRQHATERGVLAYLGYAPKGGTGKDTITRIGFKLGQMEEFKPYMKEYHMHGEPCIVSNREYEISMINGVGMGFDTSDAKEMSRVYSTLTGCCFKMAGILKEKFPGFENSFLNWISPALGIRFVRHVVCEYDIPQDDIDNHRVPADTVGLYGTQDAHFKGFDIKGGGHYGIPYRALVPKAVDNLLVAGKMISSDWVVWMSTRLTGACFLQGQAVGTAAAIAARRGISTRDVDTAELRAALVKDGVYLG